MKWKECNLYQRILELSGNYDLTVGDSYGYEREDEKLGVFYRTVFTPTQRTIIYLSKLDRKFPGDYTSRLCDLLYTFDTKLSHEQAMEKCKEYIKE